MDERRTWFKFYGSDWLIDGRIMRMSTEDRLCYITILCLASIHNNKIREVEETIIALSHLYNDPYETENEYTRASGCVERFISNGSVTQKDGVISINNWEKRQTTYLSNAERQAKFRERNAPVTGAKIKSNAENNKVTLDKIREDKIRDTKADKSARVIVKKEEKPFDFEEELEKLKNSSRKDHKIIALYWKKKGYTFLNRLQFEPALRRELRPAKNLTGYSGEEVARAINYCMKEYPDIYTLETIHKRIADLINKK